MEMPSLPPESEKNRQLGIIAELLERSGIELDGIQQINAVRVGTYQQLTKDAEGEAHIHDLNVANVTYTPIAKGSDRDFIRQAPPSIIRPAKKLPKRFRGRTAAILPDMQVAYRQYENGELDPIHDEQAIDVALQVVRHASPDLIVLLGDNLDLPSFGRYEPENSFQRTTQKAIDYMHTLLATIRASAPEAEIVYLAGNHEARLKKYIMRHAMNVAGLRQANMPQEWSVLSIPFLLRAAELDVKYLDAYPAHRYWINDRLKAIHGDSVRSGGSTAAAYANREDTSTVFGHVHRIESHMRTIGTSKGAKFVVAASFGCLSRIDGAVPSYGSATDDTEQPVTHWENWQNGLGIIHYSPGDSPFAIDSVHIDNTNGHKAYFDGKTFAPNR
jgi:hypothetical protein